MLRIWPLRVFRGTFLSPTRVIISTLAAWALREWKNWSLCRRTTCPLGFFLLWQLILIPHFYGGFQEAAILHKPIEKMADGGLFTGGLSSPNAMWALEPSTPQPYVRPPAYNLSTYLAKPTTCWHHLQFPRISRNKSFVPQPCREL